METNEQTEPIVTGFEFLLEDVFWSLLLSILV